MPGTETQYVGHVDLKLVNVQNQWLRYVETRSKKAGQTPYESPWTTVTRYLGGKDRIRVPPRYSDGRRVYGKGTLEPPRMKTGH